LNAWSKARGIDVKYFCYRIKKEPTGVAGGSSYAGPALGY